MSIATIAGNIPDGFNLIRSLTALKTTRRNRLIERQALARLHTLDPHLLADVGLAGTALPAIEKTWFKKLGAALPVSR